MKISIVGLGIQTASLIALSQNKSFDVVDVCSNADEIKKLPAHRHNDEFTREFRLRQKSIARKKKEKPARGGGKP